MALLTEERENKIRITLATVVMLGGTLLSVLKTEAAYSLLPTALQNSAWAITGGLIQLGVAVMLWVPRFRKAAAIAFVLICSLQALFLYYHLVIAADLVLRGPSIIFLVLLFVLCIKAGLKIIMHSQVKRDEARRA